MPGKIKTSNTRLLTRWQTLDALGFSGRLGGGIGGTVARAPGHNGVIRQAAKLLQGKLLSAAHKEVIRVFSLTYQLTEAGDLKTKKTSCLMHRLHSIKRTVINGIHDSI